MKIELDLEVISRDTIKPACPTPDHLREYQLSFLDQIAPPVFMPMIFFYPADDTKLTNSERSNHLKKSLSKALAKFYPLAGRDVDNFHVICDDQGAPYFEKQAACKLSDVVSDPNPDELKKFLPYELDDARDLSLAIQVTFFGCGGLAVGVAMSHKIGDALSFFMLVNSWAAAARGQEEDVPSPKFEAAALFPPRDVEGFKPGTGIVKDNIVTKRFIFSNSKITALRDKLAHKNPNAEYPQRPTRIEALSAFLWSRYVAKTQTKADRSKIYLVVHAVNLRTRIDPPLSEYHFGNISRLAITVPSLEDDDDKNCYNIVNKVRDAIRKVDSEYVAKLREGEKHLDFMKETSEKFNRGEVVSFNFTSLCRFPLYEADFGWGSPVWAGSTGLTFKNLVTFMDTKSGDGIEAWINLTKEDMDKFQADFELQTYASSPNNSSESITQV